MILYWDPDSRTCLRHHLDLYSRRRPHPSLGRKTDLFGDGSIPIVVIRFLAELTLQGTFVEIPEVLFYRRMHPGASISDRGDDERQQQFWKAEAGRF